MNWWELASAVLGSVADWIPDETVSRLVRIAGAAVSSDESGRIDELKRAARVLSDRLAKEELKG